MPSVTNITQNCINNTNKAFRLRKIKKFLPGDKIIEKLGKTLIYEMDLPNGKTKAISYVKGRKNYISISNETRSITKYLDAEGNIIDKVKRFYA